MCNLPVFANQKSAAGASQLNSHLVEVALTRTFDRRTSAHNQHIYDISYHI